ncbi:MAG: hypothetical protein LBG15_14695, partial [Dysgonamonadaceae bacterium]|nr:hypothetical protein [Dysgonamonadaceae bacterium]
PPPPHYQLAFNYRLRAGTYKYSVHSVYSGFSKGGFRTSFLSATGCAIGTTCSGKPLCVLWRASCLYRRGLPRQNSLFFAEIMATAAYMPQQKTNVSEIKVLC